jgi:hypothetical protein
MNIRTCSKCDVEYEHYGQKHSVCRPCKRIYDREQYAKKTKEQKEHKQELQKQRYIQNRQYMYDYLSTHPCEVCGESDPVVLEFDHLDQSTKHTAVGLMADYSLTKIKEEIAKCRVLCANCHKRHTAIQMDWYKHLVR